MNTYIDLQVAYSGDFPAPSVESLQTWVNAALTAADFNGDEAELSVRLVDENESQDLNSQYRGKDKPTNVLSFPFERPQGLPADVELPLGDLIICVAVVEREAVQQQKTSEAHWAHMLVHGTLHLLGFDHIEDDEAEAMESLETKILTALGYANPYLAEHA